MAQGEPARERPLVDEVALPRHVSLHHLHQHGAGAACAGAVRRVARHCGPMSTIIASRPGRSWFSPRSRAGVSPLSSSMTGIAPALLAAIVWLAATPVSADVIWRGDFETGTTEQWRGAPKSDGVKVVEAPVRAGKYALRIDGTNAARRGDLD